MKSKYYAIQMLENCKFKLLEFISLEELNCFCEEEKNQTKPISLIEWNNIKKNHADLIA